MMLAPDSSDQIDTKSPLENLIDAVLQDPVTLIFALERDLVSDI